MGLALLIIVGAALGWLISIVTGAEHSRALGGNVAAGIAGGVIAGVALTPWLGTESLLSRSYRVDTLLVSLLGSVIMLAAVNLLRGRELR